MDGVILYQVSSLQVVEGGPVITYGNIVREKTSGKQGSPSTGPSAATASWNREERNFTAHLQADG